MNCKCCNNEIESGRLAIGLDVCKSCAFRGVSQVVRKGAMIYSHKTAGEIQIMSSDSFKDYRKYNPYGKNTGRGSGLHRVTKTTSSI